MIQTPVFSHSTVRRNSASLYQGMACLPLESHHERVKIQQIVQRGMQELMSSPAFAHCASTSYPTATRFTAALSEHQINVQLFDTKGERVGEVLSLRFASQDPLSILARGLLKEVSALYRTPPLPTPGAALPTLRSSETQTIVEPAEAAFAERPSSTPPAEPIATLIQLIEDQQRNNAALFERVCERLERGAGETQTIVEPAEAAFSERPRSIPREENTAMLIQLIQDQQRQTSDLVERMCERLERGAGETAAAQTQTIALLQQAHEQALRQMQAQTEQLASQLRAPASTDSAPLEQLLRAQQQALSEFMAHISTRLEQAEARTADAMQQTSRVHQAEIERLRAQVAAIEARPLPVAPQINLAPLIDLLARHQAASLALIERLAADRHPPLGIEPLFERLTGQHQQMLRDVLDQMSANRDQADRRMSEKLDQIARAHQEEIERLFSLIREMQARPAPLDLQPLIELLTRGQAQSIALLQQFTTERRTETEREPPVDIASLIERLTARHEQMLREVMAQMSTRLDRADTREREMQDRMQHADRAALESLAPFLDHQREMLSDHIDHTARHVRELHDTYQRELDRLHEHLATLLTRPAPLPRLASESDLPAAAAAPRAFASPMPSATQTPRALDLGSPPPPPFEATTPPSPRRAASPIPAAAAEELPPSVSRREAIQTLQEGIDATVAALTTLPAAGAASDLDPSQSTQALRQLDTLLACLQYSREARDARTPCKDFTTGFLARFSLLDTKQKELLAAEQAILEAHRKLPSQLRAAASPSPHSSPGAAVASPQLTPRKPTGRTLEKQRQIETQLIPEKERKAQLLLEYSATDRFVQQLIQTTSRPCYTRREKLIDFTTTVMRSIATKAGGTSLVAQIESLKYEEGLFAGNPEAVMAGRGISQKGDRLLAITAELKRLREDLLRRPSEATKLVFEFIMNPEHFTAIRNAAHMQATISFLQQTPSRALDRELIEEECREAQIVVDVLTSLLQGFNRAISVPRGAAAAAATGAAAAASA